MIARDLATPVLIVGKGPSARPVEATATRYVAALNEAASLCERCDWLFVNDFSALATLSRALVANAGTLVLPNHLHRDPFGATHCHWARAIDTLGLTPRRVDVYRLFSDPHFGSVRHLPEFGRIHSVAETAIAWLLRLGFGTFQTIGIDPAGGYADNFAGGPQTDKPAEWFQQNWLALEARVQRAGATIERIA